MDSLITLLRDKRNIRNEERRRSEAEQELQHRALLMDFKELKDKRLQCVETIAKNMNTITGHRHTIDKVVHQSEQCTGLPISNKHHRQAVDFFSDAIDHINNQGNLRKDENLKDSIDACKLSADVRLCAQSAADNFKGIKSSVDKAETLINGIHIIADECSDEDPSLLDTSIFQE